MLDVNDFSQLRIGLATADTIRMWSNGDTLKLALIWLNCIGSSKWMK